MPRESIHFVNPPDGPFQLEVGWQRDCDVQVGIAASDHRHLVDCLYADRVEQIGSQLVTSLASVSESEFATVGRLALDAVTSSSPFGDSVWVHPYRSEINALIRLLRKARDSAFGRDE